RSPGPTLFHMEREWLRRGRLRLFFLLWMTLNHSPINRPLLRARCLHTEPSHNAFFSSNGHSGSAERFVASMGYSTQKYLLSQEMVYPVFDIEAVELSPSSGS